MMDALNLMIKSRSRMLLLQPFFGHLVMNLRLVEVQNESIFNTAATDGKNIWYNKKFIEKIYSENPEYVAFVLAHEVLHVVYSHMTRRKNRNPKLWNFACDYVINSTLKESGFKLLPGVLYNQKYKDWTSEQVYEDLIQNSQPDTSSGKGGTDGHFDYHPGDDGYPGDEVGEAGECSEADDLEQKWKDILIKAASSVDAGDVPGSIKRMIDSLTNPKIKWNEVLRKCISEYTKSDYTWLRPNKRFFGSGIVLPSMDKQQKVNLAVAIDTSGSISNDDIQAFMGEINSIVSMYDEYEINAAYFDTRIHNPSTIKSESEFTEFMNNIGGGGGTMFEVWWDYAYENDWLKKANAVVFFTDGCPCGSWIPDNVHHNHIFWVVKGTSNQAPIGTTLLYDD